MIVTIDGPAGAGKSSIARLVAEKLGFEFLDTGALYRAVTLAAIRHQTPWSDTDALTNLAHQLKLQWQDYRVYMNSEDVTDAIRTPEVTTAIRYVADVPAIRLRLSELQRAIAAGRNIVTEGRDQGSFVFPDAQCKIFLTASNHERARRRHQQLVEMGSMTTLEEILAAQNRRDAEDASRPMGALYPAEDAVVLETDGMSPEDVLQEILRIVDNVMQESH
jgi:cytidylate kinase/pantoate ligase/cytidylate kinase